MAIVEKEKYTNQENKTTAPPKKIALRILRVLASAGSEAKY
jgi:hypothetical protein